jgi:(E)-4-hydroxy-3-methylbut-2-enyl-diphosphate synthase
LPDLRGDIAAMVHSIKSNLAGKTLNRQIKIAVMGCVVNGPGEAEHADFGVACGKGRSVLFKRGKGMKVVNNEEVMNELVLLLDEFTCPGDSPVIQ